MRRHHPLEMHLADEVVEHHLDRVEVGDDAVLERAHRDDAFGRLADHRLAFDADRERALGFGVDRDNGGFGDDDAFPAHVDEGVGSAEIDAEVPAEEPEEGGKRSNQRSGPPSWPLDISTPPRGETLIARPRTSTFRRWAASREYSTQPPFDRVMPSSQHRERQTQTCGPGRETGARRSRTTGPRGHALCRPKRSKRIES